MIIFYRFLHSIAKPWFKLLPAVAIAAGVLVISCSELRYGRHPSPWWKGNLHTHSLWSDGDDYPEMIVEWYKEQGYQFLALSDHNVVLDGTLWIYATNNAGGKLAFTKYLRRFGTNWVERGEVNGKPTVRLKTLNEFRKLFEEPGRFLLIPSEEITDQYKALPIHVNATNLRELIRPQGGSNVLEVMQNNINAVLQQRKRTGQPMFPHLNHPNFGWAVTAEELMRVQGERFFEVYNGHPAVHNDGDTHHVSTDRMWDIILTWRLAVLGLEPIYALAVDDSHHYHAQASTNSNAGRGWVMVRAPQLKSTSIIQSLEAGEFYASSGVRLKDVQRRNNLLSLEIDPEAGVAYTVQFIGTRKGFDQSHEPVRGKEGDALPVTQRYSPEIGAVLAEVKGTRARYEPKGDELYVRAKVFSTKLKANATATNEMEMAWTQPIVTGMK